MKRIKALYAVTAFAALSFAGQAFAMGGGMGGGQGHGSMSGSHEMASGMSRNDGGKMHSGTGDRQGTGPADMMQSDSGTGTGTHQGSMGDQGTQHTSMHGTTGSHEMMQDGTGSGTGHQHGQMEGSGSDANVTEPPATPSN